MQHYSEWYFQDWKEERQVNPNGTQRRFFSYHGAYYRLPARIPHYKAVQIICFLLALAGMLYLNLGFLPSPELLNRRIGAACLLSLAPTVFWAVGWLCLLPVSGPMTYRRYRRSLVRIRWASSLAWVALTLAVGLEGTALLTGGGDGALRLPVLLGTWAAVGTAAALSWFPCEKTEEEVTR